jgi:hypothetical protein
MKLADMVANDRNRLAYQIAEVYAWRGETDNAFEGLQISYDNHDTGLLSLLIDRSPDARFAQRSPLQKHGLEGGFASVAMSIFVYRSEWGCQRECARNQCSNSR